MVSRRRERAQFFFASGKKVEELKRLRSLGVACGFTGKNTCVPSGIPARFVFFTGSNRSFLGKNERFLTRYFLWWLAGKNNVPARKFSRERNFLRGERSYAVSRRRRRITTNASALTPTTRANADGSGMELLEAGAHAVSASKEKSKISAFVT